MRILVDGHNLIGQMRDISLADAEDEVKLVQRLKLYRAAAGAPITVVFDHGEFYVPPSYLSGSGVNVIFASQASSADRVIISRIMHDPDPQSLLVVSSDQAIVDAARGRGARTMSALEFAQVMSRSHGPKRRRRLRAKPEPGLSAREMQEWLDLFRKRTRD